MASPAKLAVYGYDMCPFCTRVKRAIQELGLEDVEWRDTLTNGAFRRELVEETGRGTVPVLRIEDEDGDVRWMRESADIVAYLREKYAA